MSRVLVINSGSSSLKYQLIELDGEHTLASGLIERIGEVADGSSVGISLESPPVDAHHTRDSKLTPTDSVQSAIQEEADVDLGLQACALEPGGKGDFSPSLATPAPTAVSAVGLVASMGGDSEMSPANEPVRNHTAAFELMLRSLEDQGFDPGEPLAAIGHRVVHGGERFREPTIVTEEVKREIDALSALAPLHNPPNLAGIVAAGKTFPGIPQVAVFDTAFHQTLAPAAYTYAIDADLAAANHIRRYGFHGTSFEYVAGEAARFLGRPLEDLKLIVLHIGNGASACAISGGRSVETSMGMTPLEGLMMGTRGGDIDPGVLIHLQRSGGLSADALDDLLNHGSGLLGLGGHGDIRDVQKAAEAGDERAQLAFDVYLHRIRHYVGAYLAQLGGADAIVFTAGVGENNAAVRAGALAGLGDLGIRIHTERNQSSSREARSVSADDSSVAVLVIPTNEELEIARQALAAVQSS